MSRLSQYFVTGTDTDAGKTVAAAWLVQHLNAKYWKPTQSGLEQTDVQALKSYINLADDCIIPSTYELQEPLSPHEAARREGVQIDMDKFQLPDVDGPLIIEGAGGLMVPLNEKALVIDLIKQLKVPAILVCRSGLGTINHTLLSLEALRSRDIPIHGIIINGPITPHNRQALEEYGKEKVIAEIPQLDAINAETLASIQPEIEI